MSPRSFLTVVGVAVGLVLASQGAAFASPIRAGFADHTLGPTDDSSSGSVALGFNASFFGRDASHAYVNNNGNVTFDGILSRFTPFDFHSTTHQIIAPFFADVDTRSGNPVTFGTGQVDGRAAFGVNWPGVGYFNLHNDRTNSMQLLLIDRANTGAGNFDIEFNYGRAQWETGDSSGGANGLGGAAARIGFSNGTQSPGTFYEMPGSGQPGSFLDGGPAGSSLIQNCLNSNGVLGRYVFHVRNGDVLSSDGEPGRDPRAAPEPGGLLLGLLGALLLAARAGRGVLTSALAQALRR